MTKRAAQIFILTAPSVFVLQEWLLRDDTITMECCQTILHQSCHQRWMGVSASSRVSCWQGVQDAAVVEVKVEDDEEVEVATFLKVKVEGEEFEGQQNARKNNDEVGKRERDQSLMQKDALRQKKKQQDDQGNKMQRYRK